MALLDNLKADNVKDLLNDKEKLASTIEQGKDILDKVSNTVGKDNKDIQEKLDKAEDALNMASKFINKK